ncbi:hypothetical protein RQP46_004746 [Phenoliferia psychrophenolica]
MSLFKRRGSSKTPSLAEGPPSPAPAPPSKSPRKTRKGSLQASEVSPPAKHLDDFGRVLERPNPAFSSSTSGGAAPSAFGHGHGVGDDHDHELVLMFGYMPLATTMELRSDQVAEIVERCAVEIRERGLDTPLVLSTMSLDISAEDTTSLIRSYLTDANEWAYNLHLAPPLALGTFLKWGLARLVNDKGGRGFLSWDSYESWKTGERATAYPARHCSTALIGRLPNVNAKLLSSLLSLFSSICAYSSKNGLTPRKLAGLFSPYVFGLSDDKSFDETYVEWQRATDAFEHILLAFIRDQAASGRIPTHLEQFIVGYPAILNISYSASAAPKVPKGGRVEEVTRVRRFARFHSRNLIQTAGTWTVPHCPDWSLFFPLPSASVTSLVPSNSAAPPPVPTPLFTPHYRHLLNIRSTSRADNNDDEGELQRYKTVVDKKWGSFGDFGFSDIDSGKLEFDLTEGERNKIRAKHETLDWGSFESSGFGGRDTFGTKDLIFHQNIAAKVQAGPVSQQQITARLRETEKLLPPFLYDTTPKEEKRLLVDVNFFEAWADVLVSGGWARDELKESSFALVQWKARVRDGEIAKGRATGPNEDRTEERWVLVEEYVPREYRDELRDGKKKPESKGASFLRSVRKKPKEQQPVARLTATQITHPHVPHHPAPASASTTPRQVDESVFATGRTGDTKLMSLSNVALGQPDYAPSVISSVGAGHGHPDSIVESGDDDTTVKSMHRQKSSPTLGAGLGGTISSQRRESAFQGAGVPSRTPGYQMPTAAKTFLARISSRKVLKPQHNTSPYGQNGAAATAQVSPTESVDSYGPPDVALGPDIGITIHGVDSRPRLSTVESVNSSLSPPPAPPPKSDRRPSAYTSSSATTTDDEGPYDGIEDDEAVEEGTVLFRGEMAGSPHAMVPAIKVQTDTGDRPIVMAPHTVQLIRPLPVPVDPATVIRPLPVPEVGRPARHESLPPSPKPDAEVPIDEEIRYRDKFSSGISTYSMNSMSPHSQMGGEYEERDNVRLTQYGFGDDHHDYTSTPPLLPTSPQSS